MRKLVGAGVHISSAGLTNRLLIVTVATMICQSYSFNTIVNGRISRARTTVLKGGVTSAALALNMYGLVQEAADSANNLYKLNAFYYSALYERNLEMLYFLIEPIITRSPYLNPMLISDDELVDLIVKLTR